MNTSNIANYKPKDFAELFCVSVQTLQGIERGEKIAKEFQNGNKPGY